MPHQQPHIDYSALSLEQLAHYTQQGHQEAFRHIVQQCNQHLYRVAFAVLNNDDDAQDALQNAYLNAYQHIGSYKGDAQLSTWLTRITLNACYQLQRRQKNHLAWEAMEQAPAATVIPFPNSAKDPLVNTSHNQIKRLLETSIRQLPQQHRMVLMLRDIEQLSTAETAAILGLSEANVKTQLHRARQQLKEEMAKHINGSLAETFVFLGDRCANLTHKVMARIYALSQTQEGE